ncbi:MAG: TerC family protein [Proteobacteria bacterium]|nr:TerC family protein [Pseudomonadota bacterium]
MIEIIFSLLTLILLEAVLGIDNLVFIAIISSRLPTNQQKKARRTGLLLAWVTRLLLLSLAYFIILLTHPLFTIYGFKVSWHDLFLLGGGLFLLAKGTHEIHTEMEVAGNPKNIQHIKSGFTWVIFQIALFDIIFSLDSILTAVGLTQRYWVMATAITIAIFIMLLASEPLSRFINQHPTVKILALSFVLLIGVMLIADGLHYHIPRGYIYFAVCFSLLVEILNNLISKRKKRIREQ